MTKGVDPISLYMPKNWLREPLLHFLLIGFALFVVYNLQSEPLVEEQSNQIIITTNQVDRLMLRWEKKWKRPPNSRELQQMIEQQVREQVFYREAIKLGLDKDDPVVRRRMAQKMEFISSDLAAQVEPGDAELEAYLAANPKQFELPRHISFVQIYLNADRRGAHLEADAQEILEALNAATPQMDISSLGDPFMFEQRYENQPDFAISRTFGSEFSHAVFALSVGSWQGPVRSGVGYHIVRVDARSEASQPEFSSVRDKVKLEWASAQRRKMEEALYEGLRKKYEVVLPDINNKP